MKIWCSKYELVAHAPLNSKVTHNKRQGALLKVEFEEGVAGYADCHPWVELGDAPLSEQLELLGRLSATPLTRRSLYFATIDANARAKQISLFNGLIIPNNHFLIPNLLQWDPSVIESALEQGFTRFKVKLGNILDQELARLKELLSLFPSNSVKVRLDFNLKLSRHNFESVLKTLGEWKEFIDFYEDPISFDKIQWASWQKNGHTLACDYQSQQAIDFADSAKVLVIKPAIQNDSVFMKRLHSKQRLVFTSYLDHPLGQLSAAYIAAVTFQKIPEQVDICGLLSHKVYQPNEFSEQFNDNGPAFVPPYGTGFGFDLLLAKQNWEAV